MKKILVFVLPVICVSHQLHASEISVGVGVSGTHPSYVISFPVNISHDYRVEGYFGYTNRESDNAGGINGYLSYGLGAGFYKLLAKQNHTFYYGVQLGYARSDEKQSYTTTIFDPVSGASTNIQSTTDTNLTGYEVVPVFGVEYLVTDRVSIGGEFNYHYTHLTGTAINSDNTGSSIPDSDASRTLRYTGTQVIFRYYF